MQWDGTKLQHSRMLRDLPAVFCIKGVQYLLGGWVIDRSRWIGPCQLFRTHSHLRGSGGGGGIRKTPPKHTKIKTKKKKKKKK